MTDREKLIALIRECNKFHEEAKEKWILGGKQGERPSLIASLADHLIANGVVVREKGEGEIRVDDYDNEYIERKTLMKQVQLMAIRSSLGETKPYSLSGAEVVGLILEAPVANVVVREKDVVMNPVRKYRTHYSDDYCPVCGKQQKTAKRSMKKPWYCERCGQKLGWDGFNQFPEPPADMRKGENG